MKELLKVVAKKLFIWSIIINTIYSIADYGESFALSYFGTSPLLLDKIIKLTIILMTIEIIKLVTGKIGSYIDNINEKVNLFIYYYCRMLKILMKKYI